MRKNTVWQRLKVAYNLVVYGKGKVRLMTCGKCGGITIVPISLKPYESDYSEDGLHVDLVWIEFTRCLKCGAVCQEIQMWNFAGNPEKLNKNITVN